MKFVGITALLLLAGSAHGQAVEDGVYRLSDDDSSPSVSGQSVERLLLGARQELDIEKSEIYAQDNANSRFWAILSFADDPELDVSGLVLVVSDRGYAWSGSAFGPGFISISFNIAGADHARDVAAYLDTPIMYRRHPGHELLVSFVPAKERFRIGEEVPVELQITNVGQRPIEFLQGGAYRGSDRDNQYDFSARLVGRQVPDIGTNFNAGGIAVFRSLRSGETFNDEVVLNKWFAFDQPGMYVVLGSYHLDFRDPDNVESKLIWSDFVTDDFFIYIDE